MVDLPVLMDMDDFISKHVLQGGVARLVQGIGGRYISLICVPNTQLMKNWMKYSAVKNNVFMLKTL